MPNIKGTVLGDQVATAIFGCCWSEDKGTSRLDISGCTGEITERNDDLGVVKCLLKIFSENQSTSMTAPK